MLGILFPTLNDSKKIYWGGDDPQTPQMYFKQNHTCSLKPRFAPTLPNMQ